jgi:ATP-dependent RNA helicase RhlE
MKFEDYNINEGLKKNIAKLGYIKPTDIQFKSIPAIQKGEDVLAIAQTGTGKTAAFAIPIIDLLHKRKIVGRNDGIKCVVMEPTRELAIQIYETFEQLSRHTRVKSLCVFGGVEQDSQIATLQEGVDVLVATPGRMFDLVSQGHINFKRLEIVVLDEADHMLDLGFIKDIRNLIRFLPKNRQTLFFSATIDSKIKELAYSLVHKPVHIQISPKDPVAKNVNHAVAFIKMDDKRFFLERIIKEHPESKILVFVRTKIRAERVLKAMERIDIKTITLHGDKEQQERLNALNLFKRGEVKVLIATDVSARGIDIDQVEYVINYDLPEKPENYVHRVGRTGRGKARGQAISFCSDEEKPILDEIQKYLDSEIQVLEINLEEYHQTIDFSGETKTDWKSLMKEIKQMEEQHQKAVAKKAKRKAHKKK